MASYSFDISTQSMANEMDKVTHNVGIMGGAVGALQAAVIASEKEATETICQSIDGGFYMLLRSKLSQKLAQFASTMNSRVGSMLETSQAIDRTHQQMTDDFNRIKSRYVKLFDNLDRNLRDRIRELDRDAMDLSARRSEVIVDAQNREAPSVLYYSFDIHGVSLKTSTAKMKTRASESIGQLHDGAQHVIELNKKTDAVYDEREIVGKPEPLLVPVVYAREESVAAPGSYTFTVHTSTAIEPRVQAQMAAEVRRREATLGNAPTESIQPIRNAYLEKMSATPMDPRVSQTMVQLFDSSFGHTRSYAPKAPSMMPGAPYPGSMNGMPSNGGVS